MHQESRGARWLAGAAVVCGWLALAPAAAQEPPPVGATPFDAPLPLTGRDSFTFYCAPCHGGDGRGGGPVADALKTTPPDLTQLARRAGGDYPTARVRAMLTGAGRPLPAHGSLEMPIWGPIFRLFETDARVRVRIDNLVAHLETLQAR